MSYLLPQGSPDDSALVALQQDTIKPSLITEHFLGLRYLGAAYTHKNPPPVVQMHQALSRCLCTLLYFAITRSLDMSVDEEAHIAAELYHVLSLFIPGDEVMLVATVYAERLFYHTPMNLASSTAMHKAMVVSRVFVLCMSLAAKNIVDDFLPNWVWQSVLGTMPLAAITRFELSALKVLDWNLTINYRAWSSWLTSIRHHGALELHSESDREVFATAVNRLLGNITLPGVYLDAHCHPHPVSASVTSHFHSYLHGKTALSYHVTPHGMQLSGSRMNSTLS